MSNKNDSLSGIFDAKLFESIAIPLKKSIDYSSLSGLISVQPMSNPLSTNYFYLDYKCWEKQKSYEQLSSKEKIEILMRKMGYDV